MDSGATGHVMREGMFARVMLERKTSPKRFVAANGEQIRDLGEKTVHSTYVESCEPSSVTLKVAHKNH